MVAVTISKQEISTVIQSVPLFCGSIFHNVSLFLQAPSNKGIDLPGPILKFWVLVSVTVNLVDCVPQVISRGVVRETLDECLEVGFRSPQSIVFVGALDGSN